MGYAHAALRKGRHSIAGQTYLVTFTTAGRQPCFSEWPMAADAARHLAAAANWQDSSLLAWVLMPDHWHGLIRLAEGDGLPARIGWVKAESARCLRKQYPGLPGIWARAYHDRALRAEEDLIAVARYLVMNPVRAGLVSRPGDYPYWDAAWLQGKSSRL